MATKENTLRKKPVRTESHNPEMEILLSHVSIEKEIPFQVRLNEELAKEVKLYCVRTGQTHKQVVTQALTEFLANANM